MAKNKSPLIDLPSKIILSESGEEYFSTMSVPLKTVSGINGRKRLGFQANVLEVPFLKTILRQGYFEEIYCTALALIDKKEALQDISKLIFYSLIYNKFKPHLSHIILSSDLVERYNYKNPTKKIGSDTRFNEQKIKQFFTERKNLISDLINFILREPFKVIDQDDEIKEKDEKKGILKTFLQHIPLKEWFLFFLVTNNQEERNRIIARISDLMLTYLGKTKISDYIGFLLVELIQNAEKASLSKAIKVKKLAEDEEKFLKDASNREIAKEMAMQMNYFIETSWKIKFMDATSLSHVGSIRFEIMVSNRGVIPKTVRKKVKAKQDVDIDKGQSLADFYEEGSQMLGAGLGLFYISYITEESSRQGIRFDSTIESDDDKDTTYVILRLTI